ncbi:MAG: PbsX family transcriptional regulator [Gallionella sp.]|nr:PbsX family transcriptional regulator [Gallionella sp.]
MQITVKKWGNSAAVLIPAFILAAAHVALDQTVEVREEQGRIIIEPVRQKTYALDALLDDITPANLHPSIDTGAPVGKEVW